MAESDENVVVKSSRFVTEKEIENAGSPLKITEVNTEESVVEEQDKRRKREKEALKYPIHNTDEYKAKISFTIMQVIPPVSLGDEGGEHLKKAQSSFKASKEAAKLSKQKAKESRSATKKLNDWIESTPDGGKSLATIGRTQQLEKESNRLTSESEELSKKSVQHAKDGAKSSAEALSAFLDSSNFSDRKVEPRKEASKIQLYLPVAFQQNDGFQIAGTELGMLGGGVLAGMTSGSSFLKSTMDQFSKGLSSIFDMAKGELNASQAAVVGARLANKLTPSEVSAAFSIAAGVTVNPNLRSIFKGVNLREYTFQFKFLPKSQKEAKAVEEIIKTFREYSYPEIIEMGPLAAGYNYPDLFRISVFVDQEKTIVEVDEEGNENQFTISDRVRVGNKMKDCYLRSVSTNYNPSSMAFHPDGRPVEIDLSLNFVEEVTISRKDVGDGY